MTTSNDRNMASGDYEAILSTEKSKYHFYIKELQIIASGGTLESAHKELIRKKKDLIQEFDEAGSIFKLPLPSSGQTEKQTATKVRETGFFVIKALTAGFVLILVISFLGNKVNHQITAKTLTLKNFIRSSPTKIMRGLEQELYKASESELSDKRKQEIRKNIQRLVVQIKPFAEELWPLLPRHSQISQDHKQLTRRPTGHN